MWENNKKWIIGAVILLALLNGVAVYYKVILPKMQGAPTNPYQPSPFQQQQQVAPQPQILPQPGSQVFNTDPNGQMSMLPRTQPFVTAPPVQYGGIYENTQEPFRVPVQDYSSWSVDWEKSRTSN